MIVDEPGPRIRSSIFGFWGGYTLCDVHVDGSARWKCVMGCPRSLVELAGNALWDVHVTG
jgi:hypothetical protein